MSQSSFKELKRSKFLLHWLPVVYIIISSDSSNLCPRMKKEHKLNHSYCFCLLLQRRNTQVLFNCSRSFISHLFQSFIKGANRFQAFLLSSSRLSLLEVKSLTVHAIVICFPFISHSLGAPKGAVLSHQVLSLLYRLP